MASGVNRLRELIGEDNTKKTKKNNEENQTSSKTSSKAETLEKNKALAAKRTNPRTAPSGVKNNSEIVSNTNSKTNATTVRTNPRTKPNADSSGTVNSAGGVNRLRELIGAADMREANKTIEERHSGVFTLDKDTNKFTRKTNTDTVFDSDEREKMRLKSERSKLNSDIYKIQNELVSGKYSGNEFKRKYNEMESLKKQLSSVNTQYEMAGYDGYLDDRYDNNFLDRFRANYAQGRLGQDSSMAWNDYLNNPTMDNKQKAEYIDEVARRFANNNFTALSQDGWISKSAANYIPQLIDQTKAQAKGALAGAALGAGTALAVGVLSPAPEEIVTVPAAVGKGIKAGMVAGSGKYSYDNMRGAAYKNLIDLGVDEGTARAAANDEALISSLIEMGDTIGDIFLLGIGSLIDNVGKIGIKATAEALAKEGAVQAAESSIKKVLKVLGKYGLNVASEATQEGSQEIISIANEKRATAGNTGKIDLVKNSVKQGLNLNDAEKARVLESAAEGAKIAAMFGGAEMAVTGIANKSVEAHNNKVYSELGQKFSQSDTVDDVIQTGLESEPDTESYRLAKELQAKKDAGEEISDTEIGKLYNENVKTIKAEEKAQEKNNVPNNEFTADNRNVTVNEAEQAETAYMGRSAEYTARAQAEYDKNAQNVRIADALNSMGENGKKAMAQLYKGEGSFTDYYNGFSRFYNAGLTNTPYERIDTVYARNISSDIQYAAYMAGKNDAKLSLERDINTATVYNKVGGVIQDEYSNQLSEDEYSFYDALGKATGTKIRFNGKLSGNVNGVYSKGIIDISTDADRPLYVVAKHEITHSLQMTAPKPYREYRNYTVQLAVKYTEGATETSIIEKYKRAYAEQGVNLTTEQAMDEIAADFTEYILTDETALQNFINDHINDKKKRNVAQKFFDSVRDFVNKVKSIFKGNKSAMDEATVNEFGATVAELEKAEKLWKDALQAAQENVNETKQNKASDAADNFGVKLFALKDKDIELSEYLKAGGRKNIAKLKAIEEGFSIVLVTEQEIYKYISDAIDGKDMPTVAYGKVGERLIDDVKSYSNGKIDISGQYMELVANDIYHAYKEHSKPKEYGDIPLAKEDFLEIVNYIYNYDELIYAIKYKSGRTHIAVSKKLNDGRAVIIETVSKSRSATQFKNMIGVSESKYQNEYVKRYKRSTMNTRGSDSSNTSLRDISASNENLSQQENDVKRYSLKDSKGNQLTDAQAEFFKNSVVKDSKGRLKVVYHGTTADFSIFKRGDIGYHFGNKTTATARVGKGKNAKILEAYLNITNPIEFDDDLGSWDADYRLAKELYEMGVLTKSETEGVLFTDDKKYRRNTGDANTKLRKLLLDKGYDGIVYKNYFESSGSKSYIVFRSNQAKLVDNAEPTSNPDIRFSLKKPVEETKNLIAVHNVRRDKLLESIKLGGFPSPSIAITKNDMLHDKFGEISIVFRKDTISPTNRKNKVYSGDAWTPTRVRVEYDVDDDVVENFNKKIRELTPEWGNERLPSVDAGTVNVVNDSLSESYSHADRARAAFLKEKGKAVKAVMTEPKLSSFVSNDTIIAVARAFTANQLDVIANTSDGYNQYKNAILKVIRDSEVSKLNDLDNKTKEKMLSAYSEIYSADKASRYDIETTARKAAQVKENKYKIAKEIDTYATRDKIRNKFTKKLEAEFNAWVDENTQKAIVNKGIRNNKDLFTPSGSRRSFKQTHDPYTLSNIVKNMFSEGDKGIAMFGGSPIGAAQYEYSSIADIKADSGRLQLLSDEEYTAIENQIEEDVLDLANRIKQNSDVFAVKDLLAEAIAKPTKKQADNYLRRETQGWAKYSPEFADELWDIKERINNMPTGYFEAKPQRAVGFDEVAFAVIPKNDKELKAQLESLGVQVKLYDQNKEGDRLKKVNSNPDVLFSLKGTDDILKENEKLKKQNEYLKSQMKLTTEYRVNQKQLEKLTRKFIKDADSSIDKKELFNRLNSLYTYMENTEQPVYEDVKAQAVDIAKDIISQSVIRNDEFYDNYQELKKYLRNTRITVSEADRANFSDGYNNFRKSAMGKLNLVNDGTSIDKVYQELDSLFPEYFDAEQYKTAADQAQNIIDVLNMFKAYDMSPDSYYVEQSAEYLANDIIESYFDVPRQRATFADRQAAKLEKQKFNSSLKIKEIREQRDNKIKAVKAQQRAKEARMSEKKKKSVYSSKIRKHIDKMNRMLLKPSDKSHVPEFLRTTVAEFLNSIDTVRVSAKGRDVDTPTQMSVIERYIKDAQKLANLRDMYQKIIDNPTDYGALCVDVDLPDNINEVINAVNLYKLKGENNELKISDMELGQLESLYRVTLAVERSITTANKNFTHGKFERTSDWAEAISRDTETKKNRKGRKSETFRIDLENPYTFFSHYGEAGKAIYRMLRNAQDNQQAMTEEIRALREKIVDPKTVRKLEKEVHTFTTEHGKNLTLTTDQCMEIRMLMKRKQAYDHLVGKGIFQPEIKQGKTRISRSTDAILLTDNDLKAITDVLTKEQIEISDKLQNLMSTTLADYGNEASMTAYGYKKFTDPDYWPIKTAKEGRHSDVEKGGNNTRSIKNIGLAKQTIPNANNPVNISGIFNTFASHTADMIDYAAWLCPMEDANRLYNYQFRDENGIMHKDSTMKGLLERVGGKGAQDYWYNLMEDIQNGINQTKDSAFLEPVNKLIGNVKGAAVGGNIRVVIQQPTAVFRAATVLKPKHMMKGLMSRGGWKTALKYSPIAQRKDMGGFDMSSPMQMKEILFDDKSGLQRFNDSMTWGAGKADAVTWGKIWKACEYQIKDEQPGLKGDEFYSAVNDLFTEVIDQSQVVDGILQRSQTMRSGNSIIKQATAFMGEPTMSLNMVIRAYDNFVNETDGKKRTAARKALGRTVLALTVTNMVNALAQSLIDAARDDDDDDYWKKFWKAFTGVSGEEESAWDKAYSAVLNGNMISGINPVGYVPFVKDILTMLQGYDVTRADADAIDNIISAGKMFIDSVSGEGKRTIPYATKNLVHQVSKVFGISATNILRDVWGLVRTIAYESGSIEVQYEMEKAIYKIDNTSNKSRFIDILYRAYEQNDRTAFDHIIQDMIDQGIPASDIQSGLSSRAKKAGLTPADLDNSTIKAGLNLKYEEEEKEKDYSIDDLSGRQYLVYASENEEIIKGIISDFESMGFGTLDEETANDLLQAAYTYAHDTALENASGGEYEIDKDWVIAAQTAPDMLDLSLGEYLMLRDEYGDSAVSSSGIFKAYDAGIEPELYLESHDATKNMKGDPVKVNGIIQYKSDGTIKYVPYSKQNKIKDYLNTLNLTQDEYDALFELLK